MMPLHQTRATPDVLLDVGRRLAKPLNLPWENFEALLTESISALPTTSTFDTWTDAQEKGGWWGTLPAALATRQRPGGADEADRVRRAAVRRRRRSVSAALPAVCLERVSRWLARAPAVAAGNAGSADVGDVEQLDRDQSDDRGQARHPRRRHRRSGIVARHAEDGRDRVAWHCAGSRRDAGRSGTSDVHALRERPRREPDGVAGSADRTETGSLAWAATRVRVTRVGDPMDG